jgi:hypothetical protein
MTSFGIWISPSKQERQVVLTGGLMIGILSSLTFSMSEGAQGPGALSPQLTTG